MGMFNRGDTYRLEDREPEKKRKPKKQREVRPYKPLRPLSWVGCVLLLLVAAAMLCYGAALLVMRFGGVEVQAVPHTRLGQDGQVTGAEQMAYTSTLYFTFRDAEGVLREGSTSLLGVQGPIGDRVAVRYIPGRPDWVMLSSRTESLMIPLGCLLLGVILAGTGVNRIRQLRTGGGETKDGDKS